MNVGKSRGFGVVRGEQGHEIFRLLGGGEKAKSNYDGRYEIGI